MFKNKFIKSFITNENNIGKIKNICKILNVEFMPFNGLIKLNSNVKLIESSSGKLIGTYNLPDAINYANKLNQDLVLFNDKVETPLCKIMDYEDHLYDKFEKEIIKNDKFLNNKYENVNYKREQFMEIKNKIQIQDLKVKISKAITILEKYDKITFTIKSKEDELENAKSLINSIKNLTVNEMEVCNDLKISDLKENIDDKESEPYYQLKISFNNPNKTTENREVKISKDKIDELIKNYFQASKNNTEEQSITNMELNNDIADFLKDDSMESSSSYFNKATKNATIDLNEEDENDNFLVNQYYKDKNKIKVSKNKKHILHFGRKKNKSYSDEVEEIFNKKMRETYGDLLDKMEEEELEDKIIEKKNVMRKKIISDFEKDTTESIKKINNLDFMLKYLN